MKRVVGLSVVVYRLETVIGSVARADGLVSCGSAEDCLVPPARLGFFRWGFPWGTHLRGPPGTRASSDPRGPAQWP